MNIFIQKLVDIGSIVLSSHGVSLAGADEGAARCGSWW